MNRTVYITDYVNKKAAEAIADATLLNLFDDNPLTAIHISEGRVLPASIGCSPWRIYGCVLYQDGSPCLESLFDSQGYPDYQIDEYQHDDSKVIFCGNFYDCWGHMLMEGLRYLWFINTPEGKRLLDEGYKLIYISPRNITASTNAIRLIELAGVNTATMTRITQPTIFREVVVPMPCFVKGATINQHRYTCEYLSTIDTIKRNISLPKCPINADKIYLSRLKMSDPRDFGEREIENLLRENGYHIVYPETLTVDEQINLMMTVPEIVTTEGSISHNLIFSGPGAKLVILRKVEYINGYQRIINSIIDSTIIYIDAHHSVIADKDQPNFGPFYMCVTKQLLAYLGSEAKPPVYWAKWEFMRYLLLNNRLMRYYKQIKLLFRTSSKDRRTIILKKLKSLLRIDK